MPKCVTIIDLPTEYLADSRCRPELPGAKFGPFPVETLSD
jgi:hypothetical protein